jgi:uncharacterized protein YndB with AHSA1/START domain
VCLGFSADPRQTQDQNAGKSTLYTKPIPSHLPIHREHRPGKEARGRITWPGAEHLTMGATVQRLEPERLFSFTWHPYAIDPAIDYSAEPVTLVEFTLHPIPAGTLLMVVESGFAALPAHRRDEAFRMNERGWSIQTQNIAQHLGQAA